MRPRGGRLPRRPTFLSHLSFPIMSKVGMALWPRVPLHSIHALFYALRRDRENDNRLSSPVGLPDPAFHRCSWERLEVSLVNLKKKKICEEKATVTETGATPIHISSTSALRPSFQTHVWSSQRSELQARSGVRAIIFIFISATTIRQMIRNGNICKRAVTLAPDGVLIC